MNNEAMKEVLNELFSHLERLETQNEAILQFLKEKKRVTDKQLAPYLEQAGNASSVKWRAARVRIDHLLSPEHPEKELKLGKQPELQAEPGGKEESAAADAAQARPDGKADKSEPESGQGNKEQAAQAEPERKSDHPTQITATVPEQEGAELVAQLNSKEKNSGKEAA
ncbi:MAG: hypothetical protein ACJ71W_03375 [Terriglobales bacterium]